MITPSIFGNRTRRQYKLKRSKINRPVFQTKITSRGLVIDLNKNQCYADVKLLRIIVLI